jgi:LPXTG-motif cell wall-anchored protein
MESLKRQSRYNLETTGESGKTNLNNGEPDGNVVLTHTGTNGDKTTETIKPDTQRSFAQVPVPVSTDASDYFETQVTHDPDGGTTTTKTNGDGDITTIDKDWSDGDHTHVDIDTDTGVAKITETPKGGQPGAPVTVQPGTTGESGKTKLNNGEPDGNVVLTHTDINGDKTTETITPDTNRSFNQMPAPVSTDASHYYVTHVTDNPDGGTTTTKTNGDGDITTIDKEWPDGDHTHVEVDTDTGTVTVTDTPKGGKAGTPITVQPGETGTTGQTTIRNGAPDGDIILTHQTPNGNQTNTITPETNQSISRTPAPVLVTAQGYYDNRETGTPGDHMRVDLPDTSAETPANAGHTKVNLPNSGTERLAKADLKQANLPQTSQTDVQGKKTTRLPDTGDQQNGLGLIGAAILAGLAMLGFGKKRRDDDD